MRENKLTINIQKPVHEVFEASISPTNTPKWISSILEERVDMPVSLGSLYRNTGDGEHWNEYEVTQFEKDHIFELTHKDSSYKVKYTCTPISLMETELEYVEWMQEGELSDPITMEPLEKLKSIIEVQ